MGELYNICDNCHYISKVLVAIVAIAVGLIFIMNFQFILDLNVIAAPNNITNLEKYKTVTTAPASPSLQYLVDGKNVSTDFCLDGTDTVQWELDLQETYSINLVRLFKADCGKNKIKLPNLINIK